MINEKDLPLHELLESDSSGTKVRELIALLSKSQQRVRTRLREQHPPAEFKAAEELARALDASERVIRSVWETQHGRSLH